jgi:hypothetical protein
MVLLLPGAAIAVDPWLELQPGLELARFPAVDSAAGVESNPSATRDDGASVASPADSGIVVLRIDPERWDLGLYCAALDSAGESRTAREWCRERGLVAAINAGMYATDFRTHTGFLRADGASAGQTARSYRSLALFGPRAEGTARFHILDLDESDTDLSALAEPYRFAAQNLRLIRRPGVNVWSATERRWSEAALAEDSTDRALFIFSRAPHSMPELNRILLALPLGIVAAQHLEGGPEAQLSIDCGGVRREFFGSFETGFREDDLSSEAWPVPNIIGVRPRETRN